MLKGSVAWLRLKWTLAIFDITLSVIFIRFLLRFYNLYFSADKQLAQRVRQMTGFVPARLAIFKLAFSHKSNQSVRDSAQTNNERLEYLGDAVLGTVVAEYLFKKYPNANEGFLTKMRSKIVKRKSLNHIGDQMGLDVLLAEYNRTRLSSSMLGNAVEALVGAVYLEKGYSSTKQFIIQRMLKLYVDMHELETVDDNYKSQLLEFCQKNGRSVSYQLVKKYKHERRDKFKVGVVIGGEQLATADDFNKKAAEQLASLLALEKMGVIAREEAMEATKRVRPKRLSKASAKAEVVKPPKPEKKRKKKGAETGVERAAKKQAAEAVHIQNELSPKPAPSPSPSQIALPARKQRRNNSSLGRTVWHATQTAASVINLLEPASQPSQAEAKPSAQRAGAAPKPKTPATAPAPRKRTTPLQRSVGQATEIAATVVGLMPSLRPQRRPATSSSKPRQQKATPAPIQQATPPTPKKPRTQTRRPVPLRILAPAIADAAAVVGVDWVEQLKRTRPVSSAPHRQRSSRNNRGAPSKPASSAPVAAESIEAWEDTLLEIAAPTAPVGKR